MKWKILGKALLVTCGIFGLCALIIILGYYFPWLLVVIVFVSVFALIYGAMRRHYDTDNDRMAWFSNDENEEEDEE